MPSNLELGSTFQHQYLLLQLIEHKEFEYTYLVKNQRKYNEKLLLQQIIPKDRNAIDKLDNSYRRELNSLMGLSHPQIQQYRDIFWDDGQLFVVQSFLSGQTYDQLVHSRLRLTEPEAMEFLKQILKILDYIHSRNIIHRNISPKSIVLSTDNRLPMVTNFGTLREVKQYLGIVNVENQILDNLAGFPGGVTSGTNQDLYNLAVTVLILLTGQEPKDLFDDASKSWHWGKITPSYQLEQVLNRMLNGGLRRNNLSASQILGMLNNSFPVNPPQNIKPTEVSNTEFPTTEVPTTEVSTTEVSTTEAQPTVFLQQETEPSTTQPSTPSLNQWQVALISGGLVGILGLASLLFVNMQQQQALVNKLEEERTAKIQQEAERERQLELERQQQQEAERERQLELERQRQRETERLLELERERTREIERQRSQPSPFQIQIRPDQIPSRGTNTIPKTTTNRTVTTNATVAGVPGTKNIRSGPGTTYEVVGSINTGTRVKILSQSKDQGGYRWYKISNPSSGTQGWMAEQLINLD